MQLLILLSAFAAPPEAVKIDDPLPYGQPPVDYFSKETDDKVAGLIQRVAAGKVELKGQGDSGYLLSLLDSLDVPAQSQLLVYSKTALNQERISPRTPRAIYFNDEVTVAWVPGAAAIEITAIDPHKGAMFYTLPQPEASGERASFRRERRCLACHAGRSALAVPGFLLRSFSTDQNGKPTAGYSRVTHATALEKRFGGWYVTGDVGAATHLGNLRAEREESPANVVKDLDGYFDASRYPSSQSDNVAHLVFQHQMHGMNLIIRAGCESRMGRKSDVEEQLLRYLVFADEAPMSRPVQGKSEFRKRFETAGGPLRQFDLKTRVFKHRLSYLVETRLFKALPDAVKTRVLNRIRQGLSADKPGKPFDHIPLAERQTLLKILAKDP